MGRFDIYANISGGGSTGQSGALRHGIARALVKFNEEFRSPLKKNGFLTRDPRMKERKNTVLKSKKKTSVLKTLSYLFETASATRRLFINSKYILVALKCR